MKIVVQLPDEYAKYTNGAAQHQVDVASVGEAIDVLCAQFPKLKLRVVNDRGEIFPYLALLLNNCRLPLRGIRDALVSEGDIVEIMTLASGG